MSVFVREGRAIKATIERAPLGRRTSARGFSLMELMVVVLLISILSLLAIPTLGSARFDRHAYDDAGAITELFRAARTRAVARGAAVVLGLSAQAGSQRGRYEIWEAVQPNAVGGGWNRTPVSSCKPPTTWTLDPTVPPAAGANTAFIDAVDMNGTIEQQGLIQSAITVTAADGTVTTPTLAYLCFTPLGRVFYSATSTPGTPNFALSAPFTGVVQVRVTRQNPNTPTLTVGLARTVTLPASGMARLSSQ